jgi:hypothetical protein
MNLERKTAVSDYIFDVEFRLAGIPCLLRVKHFYKKEGSYDRNEDSDMDYYGYVEADWDICDLRGRLAPWLQRKVTPQIEEAMQSAIEKAAS